MDFISFARAMGIIIDSHPPIGYWRRFATEDHPHKRNGAVKFMGDHAFIQNWATDQEVAIWKAEENTQIDMNRLRREAAAAAQRKRTQQEAAAKMQKVQGELQLKAQELQLKAQSEGGKTQAQTQANAAKTQAEMQANAARTQAEMERAQLKLRQDAQEVQQKLRQTTEMHKIGRAHV